MKKIELNAHDNRWEELVTAVEAGEGVELMKAGMLVAHIEARSTPDPNEIWDRFRRLRDSLPKGGTPMAVQDIRELRES